MTDIELVSCLSECSEFFFLLFTSNSIFRKRTLWMWLPVSGVDVNIVFFNQRG